MKSRSLHNSTKKGFIIFFYRDVTAFHEIPLTPRCFSSRNIMKNAGTHPPHMHDVIIEQSQVKSKFYNFLKSSTFPLNIMSYVTKSCVKNRTSVFKDIQSP